MYWDLTNRADIVEYLTDASVLVAAPGLEDCIEADCNVASEFHVMTEGSWVWPEELMHDVLANDVVVPDEMVARMTAHDDKPSHPSTEDLRRLDFEGLQQ